MEGTPMLDVFADGNTSNPEIYSDIFGEYQRYDKFFWSVGIFAGNGANEAIKRAIDARLEVFYPYRLNKSGDFTPLWKNYLFIEWIDNLSVDVCNHCNKFIRFISFDDSNKPFLVKYDSISECLEMMRMGKYNIGNPVRSFRNAGSKVMIRDQNSNFDRMRVLLLCDITPNMSSTRRVPVELNGWRVLIEINKLWL
jgi:hypothetical protein